MGINNKNEKLEYLRKYTTDSRILSAIDSVATNQEELADILLSGETKIYLCGDKFALPDNYPNVRYIGVNEPTIYTFDTDNLLNTKFKTILGVVKNCIIKRDASIYYDLWFEISASNNPIVQVEIGECYYYDRGIKENKKEAVKWYVKSAIQNNEYSINRLSDIAYKGDKDAFNFLLYIANQCQPDIWYNIGRCYDKGYGVDQDYKEAFKWYKKAAEQGHNDACTAVSDCYSNGKGVEQDYNASREWSIRDWKIANFKLRITLEKNRNNDTETKEVAQKWKDLNNELNEKGTSMCEVIMNRLYDDEYINSLKEDAKQGDISATFKIARYYFNGTMAKALKKIKKKL